MTSCPKQCCGNSQHVPCEQLCSSAPSPRQISLQGRSSLETCLQKTSMSSLRKRLLSVVPTAGKDPGEGQTLSGRKRRKEKRETEHKRTWIGLRRSSGSWMCWSAGVVGPWCSCWSWTVSGVCYSPRPVGNAGGSGQDAGT